MENASKALLIAGSVLIVILIIGVGMLVYSSMKRTIDEGIRQMSNQEKDMFNQQFMQYEGRKNGSNVKALQSKVNNNNSQIEDDKDPRYVTMTIKDNAAINTARTYDVTVTDSDGDGLVDTITVEPYLKGTSK